jgi:Tol biopolymer transport system component
MLALVLFAACSATGDLVLDDRADQDATASAEPTAEPTASTLRDPPRVGEPTPGVPAADRIVVASGNGQIYLMDPDGQNRLDLTPAGVGGQPVWSPDGRRIAWSQRDPSGFSITSADADGTQLRRAATPFSGYFGYWSPTSRRLGFLGNAPPGTGLVIDAGTGSDLDSVVDSDTFYYFSWSPDGTRWVVHSGSGLSIVTVDGSRTPIDLEPARFRAPIWAEDGSILLAVRHDDRNMIVQLEPNTGDFNELIEVGDVTNFVLDPTGRYLAVESVVVGHSEEDPGGGISVSTSVQPSEASAEVLVYDLSTGAVRQVLQERTGGFWWSPDGTTLALLVQEEGATPQLTQWLMWRPEGSFRSERFTISPTFGVAYVPFFDQFAQSVTPWSPDSRRFVYSAFDQAGDPGVFVQPARPNTPAQRISDDAGVAFWSPT